MFPPTPLHRVFLALRLLTLLTLLSSITLLSLGISTLATADLPPPHMLVLLLVLTGLATLAALLSLPFLSQGSRSLPLIACLDLLLAALLAFQSWALGRELAPLSCKALPTMSTAAQESAFVAALAKGLGKWDLLVVGDRRWCMGAKAVWSVGMGACVLLVASAVVVAGIWAKQRGQKF